MVDKRLDHSVWCQTFHFKESLLECGPWVAELLHVVTSGCLKLVVDFRIFLCGFRFVHLNSMMGCPWSRSNLASRQLICKYEDLFVGYSYINMI